MFFHSDLVRSTSLNDKIKNYSFFNYEVSEALHLSDKEKNILLECVQKIQTELLENIDFYSQHIIVSTIELLFKILWQAIDYKRLPFLGSFGNYRRHSGIKVLGQAD